MTLRSLSALGSQIGQRVRDPIKAIEQRGGLLTHASGHKNTASVCIYTFNNYGGAQIALPLNKKALSVYLRAQPLGSTEFEGRLSEWATIKEHYPNVKGKDPTNSLVSPEYAPFLLPSRHRLLRVHVHDGRFEALLDVYLGLEASDSPSITGAGDELSAAPCLTPPGTLDVLDTLVEASSQCSRVITPEQLRRQLDRQDKTGRDGELLVYLDEIERLTRLGCPNPASCVQIISADNTAAGYDLLSEWNGGRRCIEVKTTANGREQFFITGNECETLRKLGDQAWLYRVDLSAGVNGAVIMRLQDPMAHLGPEHLRAVVWEVDMAMLQDGSQ